MQKLDLGNRRPVQAPLDGSPIERGAFSAPGSPYQICTSCVMDTTDPEIVFDRHGECNHCLAARRNMLCIQPRQGALEGLIEAVKRRGNGRSFDCLVGLSGGVDSSLLLARAVDWGLRPLVVHVDTGWNSEIAVANVGRMLKSLSLELHTVVINWKQMRSLQLAFLNSGLANLDVPQDHAIFATLRKVGLSSGVETLLVGSNSATESILPRQWGYRAMDGRLLRAVHSRHSDDSLSEYPVVSLGQDFVARKVSRRITRINALEYIPYSRSDAEAELQDRFGWRSYGPKHTESTWTAYFQRILLPYRFGYDKRKAHLSSCIASGQLTREQALAELSEPLATQSQVHQAREHVSRKLGVSVEQLQQLELVPLSHFSDYPNDEWIARLAMMIKGAIPSGLVAQLGRRV